MKLVSRVLPPGWGLEIDGDMLWITGAHWGAGSGSAWLTSDVLLEEEVVAGAVQSLHQIQQEIAEGNNRALASDVRAGLSSFSRAGRRLGWGRAAPVVWRPIRSCPCTRSHRPG